MDFQSSVLDVVPKCCQDCSWACIFQVETELATNLRRSPKKEHGLVWTTTFSHLQISLDILRSTLHRELQPPNRIGPEAKRKGAKEIEVETCHWTFPALSRAPEMTEAKRFDSRENTYSDRYCVVILQSLQCYHNNYYDYYNVGSPSCMLVYNPI